jgi:hypothetical protein
MARLDRTELVDLIEQKDEQIEELQEELDQVEIRRTREETNYRASNM